MDSAAPGGSGPGPRTPARSTIHEARHLLKRARGPLLLLVVLVAAAGVGKMLMPRQPPVTQPIAFNHLKHTEQLGLACEFCHKYVRTGAHPGLPGAETCAICHRVPQGTSEEAAKLTRILSEGDSLRFNKLFRLAPHVFYTHRRHVGIANLECKNCHGDIATSERPPERPLIPRKSSARMKFCLACHRERKQTVDCTFCHR
ncbi:MAG: cytochrome c3 family protein [Gemmatimonadota bacterium]